MKSIKIIAMILLVSIMACSFIACGSKEEEKPQTQEKVSEKEAPKGDVTPELVDITVSFEIKDSAGSNIFREDNFNYRGLNPTVLGIIEYYTTQKDIWFSTSDDGSMITEIDDYYVKDANQYWVALKGTTFYTGEVDKDGNKKTITVKNLLKPQNENLLKSYAYGHISTDKVADGESFTIVLVTREG
ncbi:MAG: hypothetical protein E7667_01260 [Ruminococcaceae bacterium]|nr:hypothetical protein [Oscillospiraceae bacterium]